MEFPTAPVDPRTSWQLPDFGRLAHVTHLDELTVRVLADNPSPMTLDGTNTYLVGAPGSGEVVVVDPGPDDPEHLTAVEDALSARDASVSAILVTHHHVDHAEAARPWATRFGVDAWAATSDVASRASATLTDGTVLHRAGLAFELVATPGHTRDHLAVRLPSGVLLSGDHVLGRGTSVVAHPDGDLGAYLASLRRVFDLGPDALYPGHGPALTEDPTAVLRYYAEHRRYREGQLLAALADGPAKPADLVARIYADVDRRLWPAAEASTRAGIDKLVGEGRLRVDDEGWAHLCDVPS